MDAQESRAAKAALSAEERKLGHDRLRQRIESEADPIGLLAKVVKGQSLGSREVVTKDGDVMTITEIADVKTRVRAAEILLGKIVPDLRSVLLEEDGTGKNSKPKGGFEKLMSELGRLAEAAPAGSA